MHILPCIKLNAQCSPLGSIWKRKNSLMNYDCTAIRISVITSRQKSVPSFKVPRFHIYDVTVALD